MADVPTWPAPKSKQHLDQKRSCRPQIPLPNGRPRLLQGDSRKSVPPREPYQVIIYLYSSPEAPSPSPPAHETGRSPITQPLGIYIQALLHFCPNSSIERELGRALHLYTDLLHTSNLSHTLEPLKIFHFTFHRKRMTLGLHDPTGCRDRDSELQQMILVCRDPPSSAAGS